MNETRDIPFHCAKTGKAFSVTFGRNHAGEKFRVLRIVGSNSKAKAKEDAPTTFLAWLRFLPLLLVKFFRGTGEAAAVGKANSEAFRLSEFDFEDWCCPHCGHKSGCSLFICCVKCGELVCGGNTTKTDDGSEYFRCHPKCGGEGKCEGGPIEEIGGTSDGKALAEEPVLRLTEGNTKRIGKG